MKASILTSRSQKSTIGFVLILVIVSRSRILYIIEMIINERVKLLVKKFCSYFTLQKIWYDIFLSIVTVFIFFF